MKRMKAFVKQSANPNDIALAEVPIPEISENEVLIQVKAIGVGIHDSYFLPTNIRYPYPIGIEAAGIIKEIGRNVSRLQVGDRVAFVSMMQPKGGTWAEFAVVADNSLIIPIPNEMSFTEAAAIPVACNTALKALYSLQLEPSDSLFIAGASGAIGTLAIQIATAKGIIVAGSASKRNHDYMTSLGASKTVDYNDVGWTEQIKQWQPKGVDAAMAIQPGTASTSMEVVKNGGTVIPVSGDRVAPQRHIKITQLAYHVDVRNEIVQFMNDIVQKKVKLVIEKAYKFEDALQALDKTRTRRARGKVIITIP